MNRLHVAAILALGVLSSLGASSGHLRTVLELDNGRRVVATQIAPSSSTNIIALHPSGAWYKLLLSAISIASFLAVLFISSDIQDAEDEASGQLQIRKQQAFERQQLQHQLSLEEDKVIGERSLEAMSAVYQVAEELNAPKKLAKLTGRQLPPSAVSPGYQSPAAPQPTPLQAQETPSAQPSPQQAAQGVSDAVAGLLSQLPKTDDDCPPVQTPGIDQSVNSAIAQQQMERQQQGLLQGLNQLDFNCDLLRSDVGPSLIQFVIRPQDLKQVRTIKGCGEALQLAMSLPKPPRIAQIAEGLTITVPRLDRQIVLFDEVVTDANLPALESPQMFIGVDIHNQPHWMALDARTLESVVMGGVPSSGKSSALRCMIGSLAKFNQPTQVQFVVFDGKNGVEFGFLSDSPYLFDEIARHEQEASDLIEKVLGEINRRFELLEETGVTNLTDYNNLEGIEPLPYLLIFVDEFQNLFNMKSDVVSKTLSEIASRGRAAGMPLILSTQQPDRKLIPSQINAKCATRIAFMLDRESDSELVLSGEKGAQNLLKHGDMLYKPGGQTSVRLQSPWCSADDVYSLFFPQRYTPKEWDKATTRQAITLCRNASLNDEATIERLWGVKPTDPNWQIARMEFYSIAPSAA